MITTKLPHTQTEILEEVLREVAATPPRGMKPVVLFDLDDTLLSTNVRNQRILREFALDRSVLRRWPDEASRLSVVDFPRRMPYSITDAARSAGVSEEALLRELRDFWFDRFFRNDYLTWDKPLPGAARYCSDLTAMGALIAYVTGRDAAMRDGTTESLSRNKFPMPDGKHAELFLKPSFDTPDLEFKQQALLRVASLGEVAAGFENEPAHINLFQETFPEAEMVFVDTKHSGKPVEPAPGIAWIRDYVRD